MARNLNRLSDEYLFPVATAFWRTDLSFVGITTSG